MQSHILEFDELVRKLKTAGTTLTEGFCVAIVPDAA